MTTTTDQAETFRVGSLTQVSALAGAVAGAARQGKQIHMEGIGAGPVNQAMKGIALARSYLAAEGIDLTAQPAFFDVGAGPEARTAMRITVRAVVLASDPTPVALATLRCGDRVWECEAGTNTELEAMADATASATLIQCQARNLATGQPVRLVERVGEGYRLKLYRTPQYSRARGPQGTIRVAGETYSFDDENLETWQ